jgi:hypothetical protein
MNKIGIAIPIFNDFETLERILSDLEKIQLLEVDFYFLDNGSIGDKVWESIAHAQSLQDNVFGLRSDLNLGFGGGIKLALTHIPNDFIGWMPGNYKIRPEDLSAFIREVNLRFPEYRAIKAVRVARSFSSRSKTCLANLLLSVHFHSWLFDTGGTPTIVSREYLKELLSGPNDYTYEAYTSYMFRKLNIACSRLPIPYHKRPFGQSHWQSGLRTELNLLKSIATQKKAWSDQFG